MEKFFHLKENGTTVSTEVMAGLTTFFAMSYIIIVNPQILSQTGMPWGGVFLAILEALDLGQVLIPHLGVGQDCMHQLSSGIVLVCEVDRKSTRLNSSHRT